MILAVTLAAFGLSVSSSLGLIFSGALGDKYGIARTLVRATPLTLCGLGIVIAWKSGMFNIGGEGQYLVGGLGGALVAKLGLGALPAAVLSPLILLGAAVGGGLYALIAGWLAVRRGVQVVISTILLNFLAIELVSFSIRGPLQEPKHQLPLTVTLPNEVMLQRFDRQTDLHVGIFVAVFAVVLVTLFLRWSKVGFILRVVGDNPGVARANRLDVGQSRLLAMGLSGLLCGLAGGVDYLGLTGKIGDGFSQNWGFMAIPVALLGGLTPLGAAISALFFGGLLAGTENLARSTSVGTTVVLVIQAASVLAYVALLKWRDHQRAHKVLAQEGA